MGFISLTHLQTALNKIKTIFDTKAELTDIPTELPANGGNADTVDGKHAVDFLPNKAECVNGANYDDFAVSGFYEVLGDANNPTQNSPTGNETNNNFYLIVQRRSNQYCSQIAVSVRADNSVYIRNKSKDIWGSWTKIMAGNADTVNGKSVFYNIYSDPTQFGLTLDSSANEIWTKLPSQSIFVINKDILTNADWNFPEDTTLYTLVVIKYTSVRPAGIYLYPKIAGKIYYALVDDNGNFVSTWRKIADGGNAATVNGHTVNANVPAGAVFTDTTYKTVSETKDGLMSSSDKKKLDGIAAGANKYTLPTASSSTLGGVKTSSTVTSSSGYTACPIISGVPYYKDTNTTYPTATSSANGLMSSRDKKKLDGIYSGATPITMRTGIVPKYGATNDTISLSYLSGRSKALVMIYRDGTIDSLSYSAFSSLHLTGISNSMTASSSAINGGSNTGCTVAISKAGVITLKPTTGATVSQRYIVIYYN